MRILATVRNGGDVSASVTVAVVSWNTRTLLARCLESLAGDFESGLVEVWVVDNGSSDGSAGLVRERFGWARLIESAVNLGFGAAVNEVAKATQSEWLAPANADIAIEEGAIARMVETGARDHALGVVAPRLVRPDGTTQHSVFPFPTLSFTLAYNVGLPSASRRLADRWCLPGGWDPSRPRLVPWAVGAFLLVRRSAWQEVGGFDAAQWMYAEDLDLGWRLRRAGWKTRYEPRAMVRHEESAATEAAWGSDRHLRWHRSTYAWLLRRRGAPIARLTAAINVAGAYAKALILTLPAAAARRWRGPRRDALNSARAHRVGLGRRATLEQHR
jgi:N-acetylglucosaminyl-diphospho-decaprenol L-rhamnosyltransferase